MLQKSQLISYLRTVVSQKVKDYAFSQGLAFRAIAQPSNYANLALVTALIILSFTAILIKLSLREISPSATIFHRLWIASLVLWLWERIDRTKQSAEEISLAEDWQHKQQKLVLLILVAFVSTASLACWAWSLTQTSVANSTVLRNLTPLFTSLGSWLFLKIKFDRQYIFGMMLALLGAVAIGWDDFQVGTDSLWGDSIALLSALFYAMYLLGVEHLRNSFNTTTILLWRCAFGALFIFPFLLFTEEALFPHSGRGWLIVILLAILCQAIGQGLLVYSLKQFSSGLVVIFLLLQPLLTALLAWSIFAESLSLLNGLAFFLVLGGIYLAKSSDLTIKT